MPDFLEPRRIPSADIKLLRLSLFAEPSTLCDTIGESWTSAQPTENLSPEKAAQILGVHHWDLCTFIQKRFRKLQLRYPPEAFPEKHVLFRPAAELLSSATKRLNWYWQSGLIPLPATSHEEDENHATWNKNRIEPQVTVPYLFDLWLSQEDMV